MTTARPQSVAPGTLARRPVLTLLVGAGVAALVAGGFALGIYRQNLHNGLLAVSFAAVGTFVQRRRPDSREARLFIATGAAQSILFFGRQYGLHSAERDVHLPGAEWVTWLGVWPLPLVLVLVGVTILSFPDGRLPSARWRTVVAAMTVTGTVLALMSALWPLEYADNALPVDHPLDIAGAPTAHDVWSVAGPTSYLAFQLVWAIGVSVRLRRARGDEAPQLRWFVYAVLFAVAAMGAGLLLFQSPTLGVLAAPLIPVAAGSAILKYRLYDIDVVISKTLVVGVMAAAVTATYVAVVVGAGALLGRTAGRSLAVPLIATAAIAVAFDPVRRRVHRWVNRLVYGERPTPYEALARLSKQLAHGGDSAQLFTGVASTVAESIGACEVTLWAGSEDHLVAVASWPPGSAVAEEPATLPALLDGGRTVRPIVHQGALRGAVTLTAASGEALTASGDRLLSELAGQAGLLMDNVDLGAELRHRLSQISSQALELRAATKRIVHAQDDARRRIERDLHDGAQQRLVTLALDLQGVAQHASSKGDDELVAAVDRARTELAGALGDLREMARGIHPAVLTEDGLEAALCYLAERSPIPVGLGIALPRRLPVDVEATAYFVVSEALTNATKHSMASSITVTSSLDDGRLVIEVTDDGVGIDAVDTAWGTGLQGLNDRLAALDGSLTVDDRSGCGSRLRAEIPCE